MSEEKNIDPEEIPQGQTVNKIQPEEPAAKADQFQTPTVEKSKNKEVHHRLHIEKKNFKEYFLAINQ